MARELSRSRSLGEVALLMLVFFVYAGDMAPMVNEAHYLVKAKNFWDPAWCQNDLFAASGKAHTTFYFLLGWPTKFFSLTTTAWIGRVVGWLLLAVGLQRLTSRLIKMPLACVGVAIVWIVGVEYGNLAGEWVVGGIEAKVPAYGFVLLAAAEMVDRRWRRVWPLLGMASALHVLTGGWSVIAAGLAWMMTERKQKDATPLFTVQLFVGGAIALFGLVPALALTVGGTSEDSAVAAQIYSFFRIKHHLLPADFKPEWFIRHGVLIGFTLAAWGSARLSDRESSWNAIGWFTVGCVSIAAIGLVIGLLPPYMPELAAKLLRYYWFRMTDSMVPLMLGLLVMHAASNRVNQQLVRRTAWAAIILAVVLFANSSTEKIRLGVPPSTSNRLLGRDVDATRDEQRQALVDWLTVCSWVRASTPSDEVFLTPRHQQTFKWYAHRAEVVNWKDVPQDATSLKEWKRRFDEVFPRALGRIRVTIKYSTLRGYRQKYGIRFMLVDRRVTGPNLPLVRVYPVGEEVNETYAVYELPH